MVASPTVRRRRLASELRVLRADSRRTIDDVAELTGISKSTLSRIENGQVGLKLPVLRALLQLYDVTGDEAARLEKLSKEAAQRGWWQHTGPAELRAATRTLIGMEAEASRIDVFELAILPGLLQTEAYADAVLRACTPEATDASITAALELRLKRQERLGQLRLWAVIAEEALHRPVGGPATMRAQIAHLLTTSEQPTVTIQVLGAEEREHPGISGAFTILGFGVPVESEAVYLEGNRWDACLEERIDVDLYKDAFDNLQAIALSPKLSEARLRGIAEEFD